VERVSDGRVAFVLGGGGVLGATQVGMLRALLENGITPDLVLGTSVGALNGAVIAADPSARSVGRLTELWATLSDAGVFSSSIFSQAARLARYGTHLHSSMPLRRLLERHLPVQRIEQLPIPFQCVAAHVERARAVWFTEGPVVDAVLASSAVPGLLPPVRIGSEHYVDGGLVHSIPLGRAVRLGAQEIYVLQVGRIERTLEPPRRPWEVGLVAFEIARRHRFAEELAAVAAGTAVHVLPSGQHDAPLMSLRQRSPRQVLGRIDSAYAASLAYLAGDRSAT
jgi:NTE family protein